MTEFSKLVRNQAGKLTLWGLLAANAVAAGAVGGFLVYRGHLEEQDLVQSLRGQASALSAEKDVMTKIRGHFAAEDKRIEAAQLKNVELLAKAAVLADWLPVLPGSPNLEDLKSEAAVKYNTSRGLLSTQRAESERIWAAIENPQDVARLKGGLTPGALTVYASVRDCASRGAGEGSICGPSAALSARLSQVVEQATSLQEQSEAFSRQNLSMGWDAWDAAQNNLTQAAFDGIDKAQTDAKAALDRGDLDQEDWNSMSTGFAAAKNEAAGAIQKDKEHLQGATRSGGLSAFDWYLLSRWTQSAPSASSSSNSAVANHPYMFGGSAFVPPSQAFKTQPLLAQSAVALSGQKAGLIAAPGGVNPYSVDNGASRLGSKVNASFAKAAGPRVSMALSKAGPSKAGIASRLGAYSAARSAGRAGAVGSSGHAGVSSGHGGGSSGG